MRKLSLVVTSFAAGVAVATTAALVVTEAGRGHTDDAGNVGHSLTPVAADALPVFESCDDLLAWYVDQTRSQVTAYGFNTPIYAYGQLLSPDLPAAAATGVRDTGRAPGGLDTAVTNSETGTNVQEAGVDEPDTAKTNGSLLVRLYDGDLVVTDVSGNEPRELSRTRLPARFWSGALLLVGDKVVVLAGDQQAYPVYDSRLASPYYPYGDASSSVWTYSVADPREPELVSRQRYEASIALARQYGDVVRLVLQSGYPDLNFVQPGKRLTEAQALRHNRAIVRASTIDDWQPAVHADGKRLPIVDCADVRHPTTDTGFGTLTVLTYRPDEPATTEAIAVTSAGNLAYSSPERLYVATPEVPEHASGGFRTEIHAFALSGLSTSYLATGSVLGTPRDRWSFDEHDGDLRVAVQLPWRQGAQENGITVLREDGAKLEQVGSVRGLGRGQSIEAVRFLDDLALVVTYRQVDPLYAVSLKDPEHPRVLGALHLPGFSSYLHPLGADLVLGIGSDGGGAAKIATFDLADLHHPRQVASLQLNRYDHLEASSDPRAFTYVPTHGVAFTTVTDEWTGHHRIVELSVGRQGGLAVRDQFPSRVSVRALPLPDHRVALAGTVVRLIDPHPRGLDGHSLR